MKTNHTHRAGRSLRTLALGLGLLVLTACTDATTARRVLAQQGYTNIEITGYRAFMKSEDDTYSTGFRATSPAGQVVTGAVTSGWGKGATIRLD